MTLFPACGRISVPAVSHDDTAGRAATPPTRTPPPPPPRPSAAGLPDAGLRLLAVHAHPDDESSKGAATMVRYVRAGADVLVATLTGGERGDILNEAMDRPEVRANLPRIRREEMARARESLAVRQEALGVVDAGLPEGDPPPPLRDGGLRL